MMVMMTTWLQACCELYVRISLHAIKKNVMLKQTCETYGGGDGCEKHKWQATHNMQHSHSHTHTALFIISLENVKIKEINKWTLS